VLLMVVEATRKKPIDWRYSFSGNDKIPYGSYVFRDVLKHTYPEKKFTDYDGGLFMYTKYNERPEKSAFIFITKNFALDKLDLQQLLSFANDGNDIFISAEEFSKNITDSLNFTTIYDWKHPIDSSTITRLNFTNPSLKRDSGYAISASLAEFNIVSFDSLYTTVLGTDDREHVNLIRIPHGQGNIFINSTPFLFTNYNILYGNYRYPFAVLSYLRGNAFVWDEFYKPNKREVSSPLRYILTQPALKAAYYLMIMTILLYLIFRGKRKQRIIPVIEPPRNMSLEFAHTLGQLYFNNGNNRDIALKKYSHFCEHLRTKFYVKNVSEEPEFCKQLSEHSGVDLKTVTHIFKYARIISNQSWTSDEDLMYFNSQIEKFYNKTK